MCRPLTYEAFKKYDWRDEKAELIELRKKVAQYEAMETYAENIYRSPTLDVPAGSPFSTRGAW